MIAFLPNRFCRIRRSANLFSGILVWVNAGTICAEIVAAKGETTPHGRESLCGRTDPKSGHRLTSFRMSVWVIGGSSPLGVFTRAAGLSPGPGTKGSV